jgi:hypothetical protein
VLELVQPAPRCASRVGLALEQSRSGAPGLALERVPRLELGQFRAFPSEGARARAYDRPKRFGPLRVRVQRLEADGGVV